MCLWVLFFPSLFHLYNQASSLLFVPQYLPPSLSFLHLCVSDPGEGSSCSPTWSGARSVPAADWADSGSPHCSPDLLPPRTGKDILVHLSWPLASSSFNCGRVSPDASPPHPWGWHEGTWRMEGAQRRQREMGDHKGEGEREAVTAEGAEGDTDACYCAWWAQVQTIWLSVCIFRTIIHIHCVYMNI